MKTNYGKEAESLGCRIALIEIKALEYGCLPALPVPFTAHAGLRVKALWAPQATETQLALRYSMVNGRHPTARHSLSRKRAAGRREQQ